ncbi:hypothetical protein BDZ97DRAFT_1835580 [Flammula alnicola]|nr:hypothetical protein BDZ97DRAFT_1835580 [Flammula alnicola]
MMHQVAAALFLLTVKMQAFSAQASCRCMLSIKERPNQTHSTFRRVLGKTLFATSLVLLIVTFRRSTWVFPGNKGTVDPASALPNSMINLEHRKVRLFSNFTVTVDRLDTFDCWAAAVPWF